MCSRRWEMPASSSRSITEPVAIQKPRATERTPGTGSVTTLTPESSSVLRCSGLKSRRPASIALTPVTRPARAATRSAGAALAAPPAVGALAAVAGRPAVAVARSAAAPAGPDAGELLDGLARDVRVLGEAQADAAALAVDLDHAHVDLVALVEDVLDAVDALAG